MLAITGVLGPRILDVPSSTPAVLVPAVARTGQHLRPLATNLYESSGLARMVHEDSAPSPDMLAITGVLGPRILDAPAGAATFH